MQYSTTFPTNENPLSEGGVWTTGGVTGLDWTDPKVLSNIAQGTQAGSTPPPYTDSIATRNGTWGADQSVEAIIKMPTTRGTADQEYELLLRFTITAHSAQGYEVSFATGGVVNIVRWNGNLNDFTNIGSFDTGNALKSGDVVRATVVGNKIRAYINGTLYVTATDSTYTSGNTGLGFFYVSGGGSTQDFGFAYWGACDSASVLTIVQETYSDAITASTSLAKTVSALGLGNLVVVLVATVAGGAVQSVQDNSAGGTNTYSHLVAADASFSSGNIKLEAWYCLKTTKSGATTITVTWTNSNSYRLVGVWEISGFTAAILSNGAGTSNGTGSGTTASGPSYSATYNNEVIFSLIVPNNSIVNDGASNPKQFNEFMFINSLNQIVPLANGPAMTAAYPTVTGVHQPQWVLGTSGDTFAVTLAAFAETPPAGDQIATTGRWNIRI